MGRVSPAPIHPRPPRTIRWFAQQGDDQPSDDAFKFRRGEYFWQACPVIGHAAVAVAQREQGAAHTRGSPPHSPHLAGTPSSFRSLGLWIARMSWAPLLVAGVWDTLCLCSSFLQREFRVKSIRKQKM
jgi:hypothetical protein